MPLEDLDFDEDDDPEERGIDFDRVRELMDRVDRRAAAHDTSPWLGERRMTQTEVGLRLATFLIKSGFAADQVVYLLAGYELTRLERPQFPVRRYLTERLGFTADTESPDSWEGIYHLESRPATPLIIGWEKHAGQVITKLASGQRFVAFVTAGLLHESRSPAEHKNFWQVVGRAITSPYTEGTDLVAVCVPRSERYRKLAAEYRRSEGICRSRIAILTVDRAGQVDGLSALA